MRRRQELAALLVLALVGAGAFGVFVTSAPAANVQVSVPQSQATATATAFLEAQGYDVAGYRTSTVFGSDGRSSVFIQRRLAGAQQRAALHRYDVRYWETRFYRPLEQGTFTVAVDPRTGEVVGFTHSLPDEAPGGNLSRAAALERARGFLREQGHDLANYERISNATTARANRVDHRFVWKHTSRGVADAPFYVTVEIHGERIGRYRPHLNVPDGFVQEYQVLRNRGQLLAFGALGVTVVLALVGIYFGLKYYKQGAFDGRFALTVGGTVTALTVLGAINGLPGVLHNVPTTFAPWQFALLTVGGAAVGGLLIGGIATVMAGAGKQLSVEVIGYDPPVRLGALVGDPAHRRRVRDELLRGVLIAPVILGVYGVFYLVGIRVFDVWLPAIPPRAGAVSTYVPAIGALVAGGTAALWEEMTYRLFGIPITKRYLKVTAVAVVLPAFVWGLGHSNYAVLPFWARAVEVTLIGIVLGVAFLRYGILATVAAHFTLNAFVTALPMLASSTGWLRVQGLLALAIALIPLAIAGALYAYDARTATR